MKGVLLVTRIRLENVTKVFGNVVAVDHVSFQIEHGEFFTIIGPSGHGKTTVLRIIAGFEIPEEGRVYFDDKDVTFLKPYERGTAMVFQNYALWPHMTVYDNVAYGLKLRKIPEEEIKKKVREVLELVGLEGLENRYPLQLSGGQQQRVALARALVVEPDVLLLDEPLSNLDAKLRIEMREELKRLQRKLNITTVYVTHDQVEALSMSDRIAVLFKGSLQQVGSPEELYFKPVNLFVAGFLGRSNILPGKILGKSNSYTRIYVEELGVELLATSLTDTGKGYAVMRPESFRLATPQDTTNIINGRVESVMFLGDKREVKLKAGKIHLTVYLKPEQQVGIGDHIRVHIPPERVMFLPASEKEVEELIAV